MGRWNGDDLHNRLCAALDIEAGHGSKGRVATWMASILGIEQDGSARTRYSQLRSDQWTSLDALWRVCREAGIEVTLQADGGVRFG